MDSASLSEYIIKEAVKRGCDKAEVFIKKSKRLSVEAQDNSVEALESAMDIGMSLRVIKNQRSGFSFTTDPESREGVEHIIDDAVAGAEWTAEDPYIDMPDFKPPAEVQTLDREIKDINKDDVIEKALFLERSAIGFDRRIKKVRKAKVSLAVTETFIFNSKGVNASYESSSLAAQVAALAGDGHDSQMGWDYAVCRRLCDMDFASVARGASKRAVDLLGAKKISTVKASVIFDPAIAVEFLSVFSVSLSADAVQKNRSFLAGKTGEKIMSPLISIVDNGLMPWGAGTKPVDDEGVPVMNKTIVSEGVLTGFLHNTYTAGKQGVASTGNAVRGGFKNLPGIGVTNLYIEPDKSQGLGVRGLGSEKRSQKSEVRSQKLEDKIQKTEKDNKLIKSLSRGILVLEAMGMHTADPISGDFSIGISGLWIENGEIKYPVKEAIITGNILELFKRVEAVGDDIRFYGSLGSPGLLIGEMDISA